MVKQTGSSLKRRKGCKHLHAAEVVEIVEIVLADIYFDELVAVLELTGLVLLEAKHHHLTNHHPIPFPILKMKDLSLVSLQFYL